MVIESIYTIVEPYYQEDSTLGPAYCFYKLILISKEVHPTPDIYSLVL